MKFKILILITLSALGSVSFYVLNNSQKTATIQSPVSKIPTTSLKIPGTDAGDDRTVKTKIYEDPSGYKFSHIASLIVSQIDKSNPDYYSSVKLHRNGSGDNITVEITSTEYKSLPDWEQNNRQLVSNSKTIKLAGLDAREIYSQGKIMVIAIDIDALITITANYSEQKADFWKKALNKITSTFAFELPETGLDKSVQELPTASGEDIVFEGEEVLE